MLPRTKFVDTNSPVEQFEKILEELAEAKIAFFNHDLMHCAIELNDMKQAIDTQLMILNELFGVDIKQAEIDMIEKNKVRGYYALPNMQDKTAEDINK